MLMASSWFNSRFMVDIGRKLNNNVDEGNLLIGQDLSTSLDKLNVALVIIRRIFFFPKNLVVLHIF